jgi:hypothetical protein
MPNSWRVGTARCAVRSANVATNEGRVPPPMTNCRAAILAAGATLARSFSSFPAFLIHFPNCFLRTHSGASLTAEIISDAASFRGCEREAGFLKWRHGLNSSYRYHSVVSGCFSNGRLWIRLPISRHSRNDPHHHSDPLAARPFISSSTDFADFHRLSEARKLSRWIPRPLASDGLTSDLCLLNLARQRVPVNS